MIALGKSGSPLINYFNKKSFCELFKLLMSFFFSSLNADLFFKCLISFIKIKINIKHIFYSRDKIQGPTSYSVYLTMYY